MLTSNVTPIWEGVYCVVAVSGQLAVLQGVLTMSLKRGFHFPPWRASNVVSQAPLPSCSDCSSSHLAGFPDHRLTFFSPCSRSWHSLGSPGSQLYWEKSVIFLPPSSALGRASARPHNDLDMQVVAL